MDLKPSENLKLMGNVEEDWCTFKQQFNLCVAMGLDTKMDAIKAALLLAIAGPQIIEMFNVGSVLVFDNLDDQDKLDAVLGRVDAQCSPKKNEIRVLLSCATPA